MSRSLVLLEALPVSLACAFFSAACGGRAAGPHLSATIGSAGGTFTLPGGPTLTIPPGAIGASLLFTIEQTGDTPPAGALASVYRFSPEGVVFGTPVTVTFPVPAGTAAASVYWSQLGNPSQFDAPETSVAAGRATAQVTHFSRGFVGAPCASGASCAPADACHAGTTSCIAGTPACIDSGKTAPDFSSCASAKVCKVGACVAAQPRTVSGAIQTIYETDDGKRTTVSGAPPDRPHAGRADHQRAGPLLAHRREARPDAAHEIDDLPGQPVKPRALAKR